MNTKVVYITGQSYSGSTFLCALLGTHPQMVPVSELAMLLKKNKENIDRFCACGKSNLECTFWVNVRKHWLDSLNPQALIKYADLQNKIESLSYAWPQMFVPNRKPSIEFEEYANTTISLYKSLSQVSGRPIIVDSSKNPARAIAISKMGGLDVSIIHLVRNGLNYLDSNFKRKKISVDQPNLLYKTFRLGVKWSTSNFVAERAMIMSKHGGMQLRYEDLISNPIGSLESIGKTLEIDIKCIQDHIASRRPISYQHMASGSHHRRIGPKLISAEYNSMSNFNWRLKLAFYLGAAVLSRRYQYL